jgi:hypothetical protein
MAKIMYSETWTQIGKGETEVKEETEETLEIYTVKGQVIVIPAKKFSGDYINQLTKSMFSQMERFKMGSILVLDDVYCTKYPDQEGL